MSNRLIIKRAELEKYLQDAIYFMERARQLVLREFEIKPQVEYKIDGSPVTASDKKIELVMREMINQKFADHGIIGEEFPMQNEDSEFQWTIDPIDGTKNFIFGLPTFGTMLSLMYRGEPQLGVINHPLLEQMYYGARGQGAFHNGKKIILPAAPHPEQEIIALSTRPHFEKCGCGQLFDEFMRIHKHHRIYYDCFAHTQCIGGSLGGAVEFNLKVWDIAPTSVLIEEAGGRFELLEERDENGMRYFNTLFGKQEVVDYLLQYFDYEI